MTKNINMEELNIKCGKVSDSFDVLETICKEKSEELKVSIKMENQSETTVTFWTEDFPELICVGRFKKDNEGNIDYTLDFSESGL